MRVLITLVFIVLSISQLNAVSIDERKTDIYFANGIGATSKFSSFTQGYTQFFPRSQVPLGNAYNNNNRH